MLSKLVTVAVVAAVVAVVIDSIPDIKRYLEIRDMLVPQARGTGASCTSTAWRRTYWTPCASAPAAAG